MEEEKEEEKREEKEENEDKVIIFADCKHECGEDELSKKDYETETKIVKYVDIDLRGDINLKLMRNGMGRIAEEKLALRVEGMVYSRIGTTNRKYVNAISELTGNLKANVASGKKLTKANVKEMTEKVLKGRAD